MRGLLWVFAMCCAGCAFLRSPRTPMESIAFREQGPTRARGAIVLLPGFGDRPEAFSKHGFVAELLRAEPQYDVFAADAHFGYYRKRSLIERLDRDVIAPLKQRGYRELWLMGTSMGGFGAVGYAREHPERIRGLVLFAPYMGPKEVVREVKQRGLCAYEHAAQAIDSEAAFARANFAWLAQQACRERTVALFVAVGDGDGLLAANQVVGDALPAGHMLVLPGGHGWKVWTPALLRLLPVAFDSSGSSD